MSHARRSQTSAIHLLDVVALTADRPGTGLRRGQVGTVVEILAPGVFEVEFSDDQGKTYAQLAIPERQLLTLHYQSLQVA
jgi:hypothetical protein